MATQPALIRIFMLREFRQFDLWVVLVLALILGLGSPAGAQAQPRFDILEYEVQGNSLLPDLAIEQAVTPYLGEGRALGDVDAARAALLQRYQDAGYLSVQVLIPEQKVDGGVVRLQVVEAPVGDVRVLGAQFNAPSRIAAELPAAKVGSVPNFAQLQTQLAEVNRRADVKVSPVLKAGREPGTVDVQLDVDDQLAMHGSVELNNRQSMNTTPTRLSAALRYDDLWARGHSVGLNLQTTPEDTRQVRSVSANYSWPTGPQGEAFSAYVASSRSNMNVRITQGDMGVVGNTDIVGLRYSLPLSSPAGVMQTASFSLDHRQMRGSTQLLGTESAQVPLTYVPLGLSYRWVGLQHEPQPMVVDVSSLVGARGVLGNSDAAFNAKRPDASASFAALRWGWQWSKALGKSALATKWNGQLATGPLMSGEQLFAGGADSVRGYLENERVGDQGTSLSVEWTSPWTRETIAGSAWRWQALGFTEASWLQTLQPALGQWAQTGLWGMGAGMRMQGPRGMGLSLDAAQALRDGDAAGGGTRRGQRRLHARMLLEY
jgi:hemolysin activation/secretion protein